MNYTIEQANAILKIIDTNSYAIYDFSHMKHVIDFSLNDHFHKEFYDDKFKFFEIIDTILCAIEINLCNIHKIDLVVNNNELYYQYNNEYIDINTLNKMHDEDKEKTINVIITKTNELNNKNTTISNLIIEYDDIVNGNKKVIKDIEEIKDMNNSLIGKIGILRLKSNNKLCFSNQENTPNRTKRTIDLLDTVRILKTPEDNYKEIILNFFLDYKKNIEEGIIYNYSYDKFQGNYSNSDILLLQKTIEIFNYILNITNNIINTNISLAQTQKSDLEKICNEIKNAGLFDISKIINNYTITSLKIINYNEIDYKLLQPSEDLKSLLKMYEDLKYIN